MVRGIEAAGSIPGPAGVSGSARTARRAGRRLGLKALLAVSPALVLGACADSARLTSGPYGAPGPYNTQYGSPRVISAPVDDIVPAPAAPSRAVVSAPLPPAPGTVVAPETPAAPPPLPNTPTADLNTPQDPNAALGGTTTPPGPVASLPSTPPPAAPPPAVAPSRTSVTGSWRASEAAGGSCRVLLSSSPSLDLYKASASGCASQDLQSVNAWDLRGNEVYLYARGNVVARLRGGGGNFNGVLSKSGAPVSLTR